MVMRRRLRLGWAVLAGLVASAAWTGPAQAAPTETPEEKLCQRLEIERRALMVLGIDKYFEKGAEWAQANLTVADLNLVKRYLDVFEQLKFLCQEDVDILGADLEEDEDEEAVSGGPVPPLPEKRPSQLGKAAGHSPAPETTASIGAAKKGDAAPTIKIGPAQIIPRQ